MLILREVPEITDDRFWEHGSGGNFVLWLADVGSRLVTVRISTAALSEYDGERFAIDTEKTEAALKRHRDLIQSLAQAKYVEGDSVVTIDKFPARL